MESVDFVLSLLAHAVSSSTLRRYDNTWISAETLQWKAKLVCTVTYISMSNKIPIRGSQALYLFIVYLEVTFPF